MTSPVLATKTGGLAGYLGISVSAELLHPLPHRPKAHVMKLFIGQMTG